MSPTFVLGTSRCGSTMLSTMLKTHPDVLSISEFWNCFFDTEGSIPTQVMTSKEFWDRITAVSGAYDGLIQAGIKTDEGIKPSDSRFDHSTGVPYFCRIIAWTTGDPPDPLYDRLAAEVSGWPSQPVAAHCRALFEAMASALGRSVIVERTGGSAKVARELREMFPDARFVFLHRDGPDTALSMSRYPTLRLSIMRLMAKAAGGAPELTPVLEVLPDQVKAMSTEELEDLMTPPFDPGRFRGFPIPLTFFGGAWSEMTRVGIQAISEVPRGSWMPLRYERLVFDTGRELTRVADFIGVPAPREWLSRNTALADRARAGSAQAQLNPGDLAALRDVCSFGTHGFDLLESEYLAAAGQPQ